MGFGSPTIQGDTQVNWRNPLNRGLVAWWPFLNNRGYLLRDIVGRNHASLANDMTPDDWIAGPTRAFGLTLDGSNDRIEAPVNPNGYAEFGLSAWGKISESNSNDYLFGAQDGAGDIVQAFFDGNDIRSRIDLSSGTKIVNGPSETTFDYDKWFHYVMSYDGVAMKVYLNGNEVGSVAGTGTMTANAAIWFGIRNENESPGGNTEWQGELSDFRIYNRHLIGPEVWALYRSARQGYPNQILRRRIIGKAPAAGGSSVPVFNHHYRTLRTA